MSVELQTPEVAEALGALVAVVLPRSISKISASWANQMSIFPPVMLQDLCRPCGVWEYVVASEAPMAARRPRAFPTWFIHASEAYRRTCSASKFFCQAVPMYVRRFAWRPRCRRRLRRRLLLPTSSTYSFALFFLPPPFPPLRFPFLSLQTNIVAAVRGHIRLLGFSTDSTGSLRVRPRDNSAHQPIQIFQAKQIK